MDSQVLFPLLTHIDSILSCRFYMFGFSIHSFQDQLSCHRSMWQNREIQINQGNLFVCFIALYSAFRGLFLFVVLAHSEIQ